MASPTLEVVVKLKDLFSRQFEGMQKTVTTETKKVDKSFNKLNKTAGFLRGTIVKLAGAYLSWVGAQKAWNAIKAYAQLEAAQRGFETLAKSVGESKDAVYEWRKAVNLTIGDADLYAQASKAIQAGVVRNKDEFLELAKAARRFAHDTGQEVLPTLERLIHSLAAGSPRALKQIGLDIEAVIRAEQELVGETLPEEYRKRLMLLEVMKKFREVSEKSGKIQETTLEKVQQTQVAYGNTIENIGQAFQDLAPIIRDAAREIEEFSSGKGAQVFKTYAAAMIKYLENLVTLYTKIGEKIGEISTKIPGINIPTVPPTSNKPNYGGHPGPWPKPPPITVPGMEDAMAEWDRRYPAEPPLEDPRRMPSVVTEKQDPVVEKQKQDLEDLREKYRSLQKTVEETTDLMIVRAYEVQDASDAMRAGVIEYLNSSGDFLTNLAEGTANVLASFEDSLSSVFFDALMGKMRSFKDYLRDFLSDISREISRFMSRALVRQLIGTIGGGLFEGYWSAGSVPLSPNYGVGEPMPLGQYGGITSGPTIAGEAGTEAIVPLPRGKKIPVDLRGGTGANINFTINAMDGPSVKRVLYQEKEFITDIIHAAIRGDPMVRSSLRQV